MTTRLNKAVLYIIAWILYSTQGMLLPKDGIFASILVFILLLVSLYYVFVANTRYELPAYFKGLNALLIMFFLYGLYLILGGYDARDYRISVPSYAYLKKICISLLPVYAFYVFSKEKLILKNMLPLYICCFFFIVVVNFFKVQHEQLVAAMLIHSSAEEFTNNVGYSFLALIPACVFFYKKPVVQYIALGCCFVFILLAMKRGAFLICVVCIVYFLWGNLKNSSLKRKMIYIALSVMLCITANFFIQDKIKNSLYFQRRVEMTLDGYSSGRDDLFMTFANYFWNETTALQFVMGSGANATIKISSNYAHNDWLEIAVNQGVLGILIFIFYWIFFIRTAFSKKYGDNERLALQLLLVIYFMKTLFSMSYMDMPIHATFVLGYSLAQEKNDG